MKLFFDQNLSFKLCDRLADLYPGTTQARLVGLDRATDREIWRFAAESGFVLVSQDSDFAEMVAFHGPPPKLIWLRGGNQPTATVEQKLRRHCSQIIGSLETGALASIEIY